MPEIISKFAGKYRFLSNFYLIKITTPDGKVWDSVEHAYQAAKSETCVHHMFQEISAGQAKKLGQTLELRAGWEVIKVSVMLELLRLKFQDPGLRNLLLATGDAELVEGNTWGDRFWGVYEGEGGNRLGILLMVVRKEINDNQGSR